MRIGWIGLGAIGTGMARRALAAGLAVTAYARGAGLAEIAAAGAATSDDYAALAAAADVLGICVFHDRQVREVLFDGGALAALRPGSVVALHTTGSPELAREIGARAPADVAVLDATFSGGPGEVAAGALTLMVGGEAAALERARPLLALYADRIHHVGPLGQGQTMKLLNNLLFAANLKHAADILRVADQQGLDTTACAAILQDCSGASFASARFRNAPVEPMLAAVRPYLEKDVATALASARDAGIDTAPFAAVAAFFAPRS